MRPFRAYARCGVWFIACRQCGTHEYVGPSPARLSDYATTHAKWWHGKVITLPV